MRTALIILILAIIAISAYLYANSQVGLSTQTGPKGNLIGNVSIGPLCPVEPCNRTIDFSSYKIVISQTVHPCCASCLCADYFNEVSRVSINTSGSYIVYLSPGNYSVGINPNVGIAKQAYSAEVFAGQTTTLDLNFDTGIR